MRKFNLKSIVPFTLLLGSVGINNNGTSNLMMEKSYLNYDSEISVSSESGEHTKTLINDFDYDTYREGTKKENESITLDLLSVKRLSSVTQVFKDEDVWFFTIEASVDGENYFELVDHSKGAFGRSFEESVTTFARYIRLNIIKSEKGYMPSSKEFYVNFTELSDGENLALGLKGDASSSQTSYRPEKASWLFHLPYIIECLLDVVDKNNHGPQHEHQADTKEDAALGMNQVRIDKAYYNLGGLRLTRQCLTKPVFYILIITESPGHSENNGHNRHYRKKR